MDLMELSEGGISSVAVMNGLKWTDMWIEQGIGVYGMVWLCFFTDVLLGIQIHTSYGWNTFLFLFLFSFYVV